MNKFVLGALATTVVGGASLASDSEWPELDRELEALSSTYQAKAPAGPEIGGWVIGAFDWSGDLQTVDPTSGEVKDLGGVNMRSARIYAQGDVGSYGYKVEFDFFDSEQSFYYQFLSGTATALGPGSTGTGATGNLLDAYGQVNIADSFHVRLGQFRTPLLQSALIDRNRTLFIDRSILGSLFAGRNPGAMAYGELAEIVGWYVAVQNGIDGSGDDYRFTGRITVDVLGDGAGSMNEGAYNASEETSLRLAAAFADEGSLDQGTVVSGEAYLTSGPFSLSGEVADLDEGFSTLPGTPWSTTGTPTGETPWAATGSFLISEMWEVGVRWQDLDDTGNTNLISGVLAWYHDDWNTKWQLEYTSSTSDDPTLEADTISLGLAVSF